MLSRFASLPLSGKALIAAALVSGALLAGAHLFEAAGYAPCPLCLDQRDAHWAAFAIALAGLAALFILKARLAAAAAVGAAALVYAVSAGLSFYHVGVEWGFWPGPATCAPGGPAITDSGALIEALNRPAIPPSCTDAAWRLFGISMAGYNLLASAGLFALTLAAALWAARAEREARRSAAIGRPKTEAS